MFTTRQRISSLFDLCASARNPVLAFSKATSKVGYLARKSDAHSHLFYLESALNESKHAALQLRLGNGQEATMHQAAVARDLKSFERAVARLTERQHPMTGVRCGVLTCDSGGIWRRG